MARNKVFHLKFFCEIVNQTYHECFMLSITSTNILAWERLTSLSSAMETFGLCRQMIEMVNFTQCTIRKFRCIMLTVVRGIWTCPGYNITGQAIISGWARIRASFGNTKCGIVQCGLISCCTCNFEIKIKSKMSDKFFGKH